MSGIPGLGLLSHDTEKPQLPTASEPPVTKDRPTIQRPTEKDEAPPSDAGPSEASETTADALETNINAGMLEPEQSLASSTSSMTLRAEQPDTSMVEAPEAHATNNEAHEVAPENESQGNESTPDVKAVPNATSEETQTVTNTESEQQKPKVDPEFLEAAKANKGAENAEWQFDSSDAESSDDSSSDSDSSDESEEDEYPLLSAEEQVRILMKEEHDGEDGGKSGPLKTAHEAEEIVEKPDVVVTPEMKITELGNVENIVDNMILIKAKTSGDYHVLESGSVLCRADRTVIGAVADTLGRVQAPLYTVAFTNAAEIAAAGLSDGTTIFYVDQHSTYVFTEALKAIKGSDASNQFDEEPNAHEMEFSDDEAEAEYKRSQKQKKRERAGQDGQGDGQGRQRGDRSDAPAKAKQQQQAYTGGLSYDDEEVDLYKPLARPEGLHHMMPPAGAPVEHLRPHRGHGNRGRGGAQRGRGRGGHGAGPGPQQTASGQQPSLLNRPPSASNQPYPTFGNTQAGSPLPFAPQQPNPTFGTTQPGLPPNFSPQPFPMWNQPGQNGNPAWPQPYQPPQSPTGQFPAGAFVNPAFYQNQQQGYNAQMPQQQQHQQQHQQQAPQWPNQQPGQQQQQQQQQPKPEAVAEAFRLIQQMMSQANQGGQHPPAQP